MRLRRAILSALFIVSMLGVSGIQVLPAAASPQSTTSSVTTQSSIISQIETQLSQKGLDVSALTNLLQQFSASSGQPSANSTLSNIIKNIFNNGTNGASNASIDNTLLAKAQPDACFGVTSRDPDTGAVTSVYDNYLQGGPAQFGGTCPDAATAHTEQDTVPKTDQAYVWGLTQSGNDLWFGTMANTQCQVEGTYLGTSRPSVNDLAACEFGDSPLATAYPNLPDALGDWRPPEIWVYDLTNTSGVINAGRRNALTFANNFNSSLQDDLNHTLGLRSAGSVGDYVLLAGPALATGGGVNVFVFTASDHAYKGMIHLSQYDNIRKWLTYNGVLYTAMHEVSPNLGGNVLKWTPNASDLTDPGQFSVVGHVNGDPAELAVFNNQMFISTWPDPNALAQLTGLLGGAGGTGGAGVTSQSLNLQNLGSFGTILQQLMQKLRSNGNSNPLNLPVAGLWMSPTFNGSLPTSSATWKEPWNVLDYEPDPVTALTYGGGAISVYNGFLYWGTMHIPGVSSLYHTQIYGAGITPNGRDSFTQLFENSERAISVFRGAYFGKQYQTVQLLYGEKTLPVWEPNSLTNIQGPGRWVNVKTKAGKPLFGSSGFGNPFNNYTWSMAVYNGSLYVGTMDWSMLAGQAGGGNGTGLSGINVDPSLYGADLWKFTGFGPAVPVDTQGLGNPTNYGIRTMITAQDGSALYVGMANPMNLAQNNQGQPIGGWELRQLK